MLQPIAAIVLGCVTGFAILVPFGGMRTPSTSSGATIYSCDVMGCKVVRQR